MSFKYLYAVLLKKSQNIGSHLHFLVIYHQMLLCYSEHFLEFRWVVHFASIFPYICGRSYPFELEALCSKDYCNVPVVPNELIIF